VAAAAVLLALWLAALVHRRFEDPLRRRWRG
jgi:peptidoglycan/LPS O-acetylase OafA/YrhL